MIIIGIVYKIEMIKIIGEAPQNVNFLLSLLFIFPSLLLKIIFEYCSYKHQYQILTFFYQINLSLIIN